MMSDNFKRKCKEVWQNYGKWFLVGLPLAAVVICVAVTYANNTMPDPFEGTLPSDDQPISQTSTPVEDVQTEPAIEKPVIQKVEYSVIEEQVWEDETVPLSTESYTLPQDAAFEDGSIGTLSIPKISLTAPVYEAADGEEIEAMTKGIAHFAVTSSWSGNVGLCSHNIAPNGAVAYFRALHLLEKGDELSYKTSLGERSYKVTTIKEIAQDDWGYLMRYDDDLNRITMITCITGKPDMRLMVQATEA